MDDGSNCRLELVSTRLIKRMPGIPGAQPKDIEKAKSFVRERGFCKPVVLSDGDGCMTLLSGEAVFNACLEEKKLKTPAVIVKTEGSADNLMFALQTAELDDKPCAVAISGAIVQLIDVYGVPRRQIIKTLGKSPAWINRMENLSRKLNKTVQKMVAEGRVPSRTAQEIARLPDAAQAPFAVSACNELLCKENVVYLVNRYLNEDTSLEERDRIIRTPQMALPNATKRHGGMGMDNSCSARLSRAIARCIDDAGYLSRMLDGADIACTAIRAADVTALLESRAVLHRSVRSAFYPGQNGAPHHPEMFAGGGDYD